MNLTDRQSIMAGILIGLGACGFLALGGLTGAIIFAFGLIGVVLTGIPLYTGRFPGYRRIFRLQAVPPGCSLS